MKENKQINKPLTYNSLISSQHTKNKMSTFTTTTLISAVDEQRFWQENSAWPVVHYAMPMLLYFALRTARVRYAALWALLLMYFFETLEAIGAVFADFGLAESHANSLIGDPLIGALGIVTFLLLDTAFGWADYDKPPVVPRLAIFLQFSTTAISTVTANLFVTGDRLAIRTGLLIFLFVLLTTLSAFYGSFCVYYRSVESLLRVGTFMILATAQVAVALPLLADGTASVFWRVLAVGLVVLYFAGVAALARVARRSIQ